MVAQESRKPLFSFDYRRSPDQDRARPAHHPVIVVGAGPVGLTAALDLALRGVPVVVLDDTDRIGEGSRGICYAKRTLEIWDRLGVARPMLEKGVTWQVGKVFQAGDLVYQFDLLPEAGHKMPAFINLQQYYVEKLLVERCAELPEVELRWRNKVVGLERHADHSVLTIDTPDGSYPLTADWVLACDGARSSIRAFLGLGFEGEVFDERFLITDVRMTAPFPSERWFWFDPPFHSGQSALLHKQPDDIWRIDLQLSPKADIESETRLENVVPRIERMLGHRDFEVDWVSVYSFQCCRIARFVHGGVIFLGDAAHQVSPFGARGGNSGVQDADNLGWKLAAVLGGDAPRDLIESYDLERCQAADENIGHSTRSTDFIAPRTNTERHFRDAALALARRTGFGRRYVNSGRLSTATIYDTPLSTPDRDAFAGAARLGAPLPDAPCRHQPSGARWLLDALGRGFTVIHAPDGSAPPPVADARQLLLGRDLEDPQGLVSQRLDARAGSTYVVRPDQHLAARFRSYDPAWVAAAIARASGRTSESSEAHE
ncbi:MAG: FAD-dependent oxidoreductase [Hyphomicrobiaceae bacterium]|nr:FAD-dependent oxidoreductase [Hyphomicrobiaceae bacterium]